MDFDAHFRYQPQKWGDKLYPYCKVGGKDGNEENYGWPCLVGAHYWEDGTVSVSDNCVFCGRWWWEVAVARGDIYCITCRQVYHIGEGCLCDKEIENGRTVAVIDAEDVSPDAHLGAVRE